MEHLERIPKLIASHLRGEITAAEQQELDVWINASEANRLFFTQITDERLLADKIKRFMSIDMESRINKTLYGIGAETSLERKSSTVKLKKYAIAACLFLIAGAGIYYIMRDRVSTKKDITKTTTIIHSDVQPGTEKAILTLSDGMKITLDSATNGTIAQQGNTVVLKEDGLLAYNTDGKKSQTEILYNTLTTPKGGEYRSLVLSDGTKVWLNSISSIRFPTSFVGNERKVEITGEVYLEVAKDKARPFKVDIAGKGEVEVLGTRFNVNAYSDEPTIQTTLLEGSVAIKSITGNRQAAKLKPGQQARLNANGFILVINDVNPEAVTAWKDQTFYFESYDLKTIMRQFARWYDVEVAYEGNIPNTTLSGMVSRNRNLSEVLKALQLNDINFRIEGKKLIVLP